jgi:flagellar protein FliS
MKLNSSHALYKQADVTCSPTQLVLLLLDGAIRYSREAMDHMQARRWAEKGVAVESALECLTELRKGLDRKQGGEAAMQVDRMYDLLITKITLGNATKDMSQFQQVIESLQSLKAAWQELFSRLQAQGKLLTEEAMV